MRYSEIKLMKLPFVQIVRSGLMMLVPILMVGSFALIFQSLPIPVYQDFIFSFASGIIYKVLTFVYNATFGMLSLYMVICLSYCTCQQQSSDNITGTVSAGIASFLISIGFLSGSFHLSAFSAVGMFTAIICGTLSPLLFILLASHIKPVKVFFDGSEPLYNRAISNIFPLAIVCLVFALINYTIQLVFGVSNLWQLFSSFVNKLFSSIGVNFFGGLLYILLSSFMWLFGIHGSDVLESVTTHLFTPAMMANTQAVAAGSAATEIYTKTFFDVFVLMGGCGSALCLLAAILLFSKRKSSRSLAKIAAFPMLFNINELMIFGLPVIYNPVLWVPFILVPLCCFLVSTAAMKLGIVPLTTVTVEWTTPIILGGLRSTGSVTGALLQVFNLVAGTLIYMPFVKRYDTVKEEENRLNLNLLVQRCKDFEAQNSNAALTEEGGIVGGIAKQLVNDLKDAIASDTLFVMYQPQNNAEKSCIGSEALLRWNHPSFGFIYPPLIIKLAAEGGYLTGLERYIFLKVKSDMETLGTSKRVSINVTSSSLQDESFIDFLYSEFPEAKAGNAPVCVEITEQTELVTNSAMINTLTNLRRHGFRLAIDDFSMGYTSMKYLQDSSFDEVKLDGSLVRSMTDSPNTREIISSIVYLSQSLGFSVLAEFVETDSQQKLLETIGCLEYQGYLFSKPISRDELSTYFSQSQEMTLNSMS